MKTLIGTLALGLSITTAALAAPSTTKYTSKGDSAYASAYANNDCGYAGIDINASEDVTKTGGSSTASKTLWVNYYAYDSCKGTESYGSAQLPLTVDVNTTSVTLDFALDVVTYAPKVDANGEYSYEEKGTAKLTGSFALVGTGTLQKGSNRSTSTSGPYRSVYRYSGSYREATVTVKAKLGATALTFANASGTLGKYTTGSAEIYKSK